ncbi:MAG TPA: single-stranded-DNA-specific exonuclease RecJ, partial [Mucilaginibacter sp.]
MNKRWAIREVPAIDETNQLATELNIDPVLSALLIQRGVKTFEQARYFFRPDERHLHDPFLMCDM